MTMRVAFSDGKSASGEDVSVATTVCRHLFKGRLSIVEKGSNGIHPMKVLQKVLKSARMLDPSIKFRDTKDKKVTLIAFDQYTEEAFKAAKEVEEFVKRKIVIRIVGH